MTKAELIGKISDSAQISKADAGQALNTFLAEIQEALITDGKVVLAGFGVFSVEEAKARTGHNPRTGETISIPARKNIKFKPYTILKEKIQ